MNAISVILQVQIEIVRNFGQEKGHLQDASQFEKELTIM